MTIEEKLEVLNLNLNAIDIHIRALEADLANNPDANIEGKPLRNEVLFRYRENRVVIENMIATLTEN
jgi:hypothetical protein